MIFAQMLEIVALSDLASVLCARNFPFDPQGDLPAAERPQHCVLVICVFIAFLLIFSVVLSKLRPLDYQLYSN